jgi:hypothetical protein
MGRIDAALGVDNWSDGLDWLVEQSRLRNERIAEVQYWGHGLRGRGLVARESLDARALHPSHPLHARLDALRARLVDDGSARWWWRTCETIGGASGQAFARSLSRFLGARVAGHTYVIGVWQSGLHELAIGAEPHWDAREGFVIGGGEESTGLASSPRAPNTIHFLQGEVPRGW